MSERAIIPWRDWFHCMFNTYGTCGDPRGFRTRHHREHVDGDYKNPPPNGKYDKLYKQSKRLMNRESVHIASDRQQFVLDEVCGKLVLLGVQIIAAILDDHHLHLLARFEDRQPRRWIGMAKKHASHMCRGFPDYQAGGLWGKRCECLPIERQSHQRETFFYLLEHHLRGATVWVAPEFRVKLPSALEMTRKRRAAKEARRQKGRR